MGPELEHAVRATGMRTFLEVAMDRVARGQTSLQEVERVLGLVSERAASAASVGPILIVDDDADVRSLLRSALEKVGFEVVEANDGPPAISLIREAKGDFSLILLDLLMPGMHGLEILKRIRSSLVTQALPVVVLTASTNPRDEIDLLDAGADDYLVKPIDPERLDARVRAVLRRSGVRLGESVGGDGSLG
jgi:DNA-binding response OmpR family regulator